MSASPDNPTSHTLRLRERLKAIQQNRAQAARAQYSFATEPDHANIDSEDNLKLQTFSSASSHSQAGVDTAGISEKELSYYQEQIARIQSENSHLKRDLGDKERELRKSQEALQAIGAGSGGGNVAGRIVELSKRVRELQSELYAEQSRAKKLERSHADLQELVRAGGEEIGRLREQLENGPPSPQELSQSDQRRLEQLGEEANELKARLAESKNSNQSLRQELRLTQKALTQELGPEADKYSLTQIINSAAAWKGRAQQIKLLKKKVSELRHSLSEQYACPHLDTERELSAATKYESQNSLATLETIPESRRHQSALSSQSDRQRELLRRMESSKRETAEKTQAELDEMKRFRTEAKSKCVSLQARNQTLSQEVKQLRKDLTESREKANVQPLTEHPTSVVSKCQTTIEELRKELHKKCVQIENLTQELKNRNKPVIPPSLLPSLPSSAEGGEECGALRGSGGGARQVGEGELLQSARAGALLQSVGVERDKLRELVALVQGRLEEAAETGSCQEAQLRQLKLSNALLEKEASRCGQTCARAGSRFGASLPADTDGLSRDAISQRIEIAEDENAALQHRLASVSRSRKEDTRVYKEMLDASRQIFTDTLDQLKYIGMEKRSA